MEPKPCRLLRLVASLDFWSLDVVHFWSWALTVWKNHTASLVNSRQRFNSFPVNSNKDLKVCHLHLKIHFSFCNCVAFSPPSSSPFHYYASSFSHPLKVFPFSRSFMVILGQGLWETARRFQPDPSSAECTRPRSRSRLAAKPSLQCKVLFSQANPQLQDHLPPCPVRSWVIMWFSKWQLW